MSAIPRILEILISDTTVCSPCLEILAMLDAVEVETALARLTAFLTVAVFSGVCDRCRHTRSVYQLNPRLAGPLVSRQPDSSHPQVMASDLVELLERDPLCLDCLTRALQRPRDEVAAALSDLRRTFRLSSQAGRCGPCASVRMTYRVSPEAPH